MEIKSIDEMKKKLTGYVLAAFGKSVEKLSLTKSGLENRKNESDLEDFSNKTTAKIEETTENPLIQLLLRP